EDNWKALLKNFGFSRKSFPIGCCQVPPDKIVEDSSTDSLIGGVREICCPEGQEWKPASQEKPPCKGKCCDTNEDCSSKCGVSFDRTVQIIKEACVKEENEERGYCKLSSSNRITLSSGQICITRELDPPGNCGKRTRADINCRQNAECGSKCNGKDPESGRDILIPYKCSSGGQGCVVDEEIICPENKPVCIEHVPTPYSVSEAKCEECPKSASFSFDKDMDRFGVNDDYTIYSPGIGEFKNENFFRGPLTPMQILDKVADLCKKCGKLDQVLIYGHGTSQGLQTGISYLDVFGTNDIPSEDSETMKAIRGCVKDIVFNSCNVGSNTNFINTLGERTGARVIASTENAFSLDCTGTVQIEPNLYPGNGCSSCNLETFYYLSDENAFYPGFEQEVYQTHILEGAIGKVSIQIAGDNSTGYTRFVQMPDEAMPCAFESINEQEFIVNSETDEIVFENLSIKILPETFSDVDGIVKILIRVVEPDCTNYFLRYPHKASILSEFEINEIEQFYQNNSINEEIYNDFKYRYDNQLECTKDNHCVGLRCTMGNLNCTYSCSEGKCLINEESTTPVVTLNHLIRYISQWINGNITLAVLKDKINLWITGGSEEGSGDTNQDEATRPSNKPETGLVAYYDFDNDNDEVYDVSGKNNDGNITSSDGSVVYASGKVGKAVSFAGSGQISVPHSEDFNFGTGEFTMLGWVKISAVVDGAPRHIFGKRDTTGSGNWVRLFTRDNGKIVFEFTNGDSLPSTFSYADDTWHFIAMSHNTNGEVLFAVNNKTFTQTFNQDTTNTGDFTIGKWSTEGGFIGEVDEVRAYNRTLSSEEVLTIYDEEK
ncbi:MAG: LamG-like jellyroll fold domain-containing protein, partial [Nanoarchaeota archaeon]